MRLAQAVGELAEFALNPVVLSGDLHWSMAAYLVHHKATEPIAVELMTTSVMSPGFDQYLPQVRPDAVRDATLELNPMLKYMETARRGWLALTAGKARCPAVWQLVETVHQREYSTSVDRRPHVKAGATGEGFGSDAALAAARACRRRPGSPHATGSNPSLILRV